MFLYSYTDNFPENVGKTLPKNEKNSLPVYVRRLKTSLPKLPIGNWGGGGGVGRSILAFIQMRKASDLTWLFIEG